MKIFNSLVFCILLFGSISALAQVVNYNSYKKFNYQWADPEPSPIPVNEQFKDEDLVYVDDEQLVSVGGALGSINNIMFQRKARLKFLTAKGVQQFTSITIPESLDPLYDHHNEPFKNNLIKKGPDFFEATLNWFGVRIIKPDGKVIEVPYIDEYKYKEVLSIIIKQTVTYKYYKSYYWNFICNSLQPGDELEYNYQLMVPYDANYLNFNSSRIFFHGETPIQNYSLTFKYKTGPTHDIKFINGGEPDTSYVKDDVHYYKWNKNNLHGCLDEVGAQPYNSLPYIIYSLNTQSEMFRYNDAVTSKFKFIPYWLGIIRVRESFDYTMRKHAAINMKDKQNLLVDHFIQSKTEGINDSLNYLKFIKVHSTIADSFKYYNDETLFREDDIRAERLGEFTESYRIREISRFKLYAKILNELKLDYFSFYLMDKRYGKINSNYQSPIWNTDGVYAIYFKNSFAMVHPKKSDFGWYVEELPFFWENSTGLLLNYNDLFYDLLEQPRILQTVPSTLNDNTRMCNVKADISLGKNTVVFDARVNLTGQYSTMTRYLYTSSMKDSINNPKYNKIISSIDNPVNILSKEITGKSISFPYKFDLRTSYESNSIVNKNNDGASIVDLSGWFNHIIYENLSTEKRQLDFYPDFTGQDTYRYYLKFDLPIKSISGIESTEITNSFGKLTIKITQPEPDGILIESHFVTTAEFVTAAKIQDVEDIYSSISKLNHSKISVTY